MLGSGDYNVYIVRRGGQPTVMEVIYSSLSYDLVLDNSGSATVTIPAPTASEVTQETEPWRDELVIYRDNDIAFVGPVVSIDGSLDSAQIHAQDLFFWTEVRFIEKDLVFWGDVTEAFIGVFHEAMAPDPSPNIRLLVHDAEVSRDLKLIVGRGRLRLKPSKASGGKQIGLGIQSPRRKYNGKDFHRASDLLRELARTALDFTTIGRTVYVGGPEVFSATDRPATPLLLHDEGVMSSTIKKDGSQFATDVAVFTGSSDGAGKARNRPLVGRATREVTGPLGSGLVQRVYTELLIKDLETADLNAISRLESMQPAPRSLSAPLSTDAAFTFQELIPGRRVDVRLSEAVGCMELVQEMRLTTVKVDVSPVENVTIDLVPVGMFKGS